MTAHYITYSRIGLADTQTEKKRSTCTGWQRTTWGDTSTPVNFLEWHPYAANITRNGISHWINLWALYKSIQYAYYCTTNLLMEWTSWSCWWSVLEGSHRIEHLQHNCWHPQNQSCNLLTLQPVDDTQVSNACVKQKLKHKMESCFTLGSHA